MIATRSPLLLLRHKRLVYNLSRVASSASSPPIVSNKKITRLESDIELEDCEFKSRLVNRNPRNLEQMAFEMKPLGFWLDKSPPTHWNRITFEESGQHLTAALVHWTGKVILTASTSENILAKYLKSTSTTNAASLLGEVLARRCLQSGYLYAQGPYEEFDDKSRHKRGTFFQSLARSGLELREPPPILPRAMRDL